MNKYTLKKSLYICILYKKLMVKKKNRIKCFFKIYIYLYKINLYINKLNNKRKKYI